MRIWQNMGDIGPRRLESCSAWALCGKGAALLVFALAARALANDAGEEARPDLPLARINGKPLTMAYFEAAAAGLSMSEQRALASAQGRGAFLEALITEQLQADEAIRRGYDKHEAVQVLLKEKLASMMEILIGLPVNDIVPTEEELRQYFEQHLKEYQRPEMMQAKHMVFKDRRAAAQVLERLLAKKPDQAGFHDKGKRGLNMGFFPRSEMRREGDPKTMPALAEAAFSLQKDGDIYPALIATEHGYHILMRTGYRPAEKRSFEEVRERGLERAYLSALKQQRIEAAVERLEKRYPVVIYEEALNEVAIDP